MSGTPRPRWQIVALLMLISTVLGSNHVAARIAFDHGANVVTAVAIRSTGTSLALFLALRLSGVSLLLPRMVLARGLFIGLLLTIQSLCLYSAVARIPVGLALLTFNCFPLLFAGMTWLIEGRRPSNRTLLFMPVALAGLSLALNLFGGSLSAPDGKMQEGVLLALGAALSFSTVLLLSERWLGALDGRLRSLLMMITIAVIASLGGFATDGFALPQDRIGWIALATLTLFYGTAISALFVVLPRIGILNNASVMNFEPVAALLLGALILGQTITPLQVVGVVIVLGAMLGMASGKPASGGAASKKPPAEG
ncbi:MAG: EamA family transporter [Rhizobiales bacterium PAR1]|nr:MAG: EamA family transporter [Rhizobiales bacterium PAR1]